MRHFDELDMGMIVGVLGCVFPLYVPVQPRKATESGLSCALASSHLLKSHEMRQMGIEKVQQVLQAALGTTSL